jgi:spore coat protein U-like protein
MSVSRPAGVFVLGLVLLLAGTGADARAAGCDVHISLVDFGRLDFEKGEEVTGELVVACDAPRAFAVSATRGFGDYDMRRMRSADGAELRYNLFVDPARRRVWGDGSAGTARLVGQTDGRRPATFTIYGFVPGGQTVRRGSYSDSVTVALER